MQSNASRPAKQVEEKRSKWRLFGKGTNKSTDRLNEPAPRHSNASATSNESHRSSATDESRFQVINSFHDNSPRESHPAKLSIGSQRSGVAADPSSKSGPMMNGTLHNISPTEVQPGVITTQSGIAIEKVFQPQSVLSSSSTPTVRQETYTDPITGETTTKTVTTVVTETTTTQVTKPTVSPKDAFLNVEEERRLAKEYLAASDHRSEEGLQHGLQPPPRSKGSLTKSNKKTVTSVQAAVDVDASRPVRHSSEGDTSEQWSSDVSESRFRDRGTSSRKTHSPRQESNHTGPPKRSVRTTRDDSSQKSNKQEEVGRSPNSTSIHAQSSYGHEPVRSSAITTTAHNEPRNSDVVVPIIKRQEKSPGKREESVLQPQMIERGTSVGRVRSTQQSHTLTPPLEEQEQKDDVPGNKRGSWGTFGNVLGGKAKPKKPKDDADATTNAQHDHTSFGADSEEVAGGQTRSTDKSMAKTILTGHAANGRKGGGRY